MIVRIEHEERYRQGRRGRGRPPRAGGEASPIPQGAPLWIIGRIPDDWFTGTPSVTLDHDEMIVVGTLTPPGKEGSPAAESGRIARFREETRGQRMGIAREAENKFGLTLSWGATAGETTELFTTRSVPVMTRLHQPERRVLDTLVDSGVARSRSEALAWCVRLVGQHQEDWIVSLRDALVAVEEARARGPEV